MPILAIETSCDETALALIDGSLGDYQVYGELISSQIKLHAEYGGVVPELAAREHLQNLPLIVDQLLSTANISLDDLSGIVVTRGPGLHGCLLIGVAFAQAIALAKNLPIVGVNHLEGHLFSAFIDNRKIEYPFLALLVSGGHTELVLVHDFASYQVLARTIDDAAGEAFDKAANLLGFDYPGGAALAGRAECYRQTKELATIFKLPKVMQEQAGFSFSGLKTAVSLQLAKLSPEALKERRDECCAVIEESIVDALCRKVRQVLQEHELKSIVLAGGVAANRLLRSRIQQLAGRLPVHLPEFKYCIDNATMIGLVGSERLKRAAIKDSNLTAVSRWPLEQLQ